MADSDTVPDEVTLEVPRERLTASFKAIARYLVEAAVQGATLQIGSMISAVFNAADQVEWQDATGPSGQAWRLLEHGICDAVVQVAGQLPDTCFDDQAVEALLERIGREAIDTRIPLAFLDNPMTAGPAIAARDLLMEWLAPSPATRALVDVPNLHRRFESALVLGVHRAWIENPAQYQELLGLRDDPTIAAWRDLRDWDVYRKALIADYHAAPVFTETFALADVHVDLRCGTWREDRQGNDASYTYDVADTMETMLGWLAAPSPGSRLRFLSGGPGSGKSSFAKALAAKLATGGAGVPDVDVLLFPLQRLHWDPSIFAAVAETLNRQRDRIRHSPLDPDALEARAAARKRLLLIFDGLDELTAEAQEARHVSAVFVDMVAKALGNPMEAPQRGMENVLALIIGRDAIFGNVREVADRLPGDHYDLLPYCCKGFEPRRPADNARYTLPDWDELADQRQTALDKYNAVKPLSDLAASASAYERAALREVTSQPLLNYFFLSSDPDEAATANRASMYDRLFRRLQERNQADRRPGAGLSDAAFDRVFETMAMAAWRHGDFRTATWAQILAEADREDAEENDSEHHVRPIFARLEKGEQQAFRLAAAFYLRDGQMNGVEFTHKSFAEYLYARRLGRWVQEAATTLTVLPGNQDIAAGFFRRWLPLSGAHRLTQEMLDLLPDELQRRAENPETAREWQTVLRPLFERALSEGWQAAPAQREAERLSVNAEEALFCAWRWLFASQQQKNELKTVRWRFPLLDYDKFIFARFCSRLLQFYPIDRATRPIFRSPLAQSLSFGDLKGANLVRNDFSGGLYNRSDFSNADLSFSDFSTSVLVNTIFQNAILYHAQFENVIGDYSNFEDSKMGGSNMQISSYKFANFANADLHSVNMSDTSLEHADFSNARLINIKCGNSKLGNADLCNANLLNAYLVGSDFTCATLTDTKLSGADLRGAKFTKHPSELGAIWDVGNPPQNLDKIKIDE